MAQRSRALAVAAVVLALFGGCGGDSSPDPGNGSSDSTSDGASSFDAPVPPDAKAYPVFVSSELVTGPNRLLVGLLDSNDAPIGSPRIELEVDLYDLGASAEEPVSSAPLDFVEIGTAVRGYYAGRVKFDTSGKWEPRSTSRERDWTRGSAEASK